MAHVNKCSRDTLLKCNSSGGDWNPGWGVDPIYTRRKPDEEKPFHSDGPDPVDESAAQWRCLRSNSPRVSLLWVSQLVKKSEGWQQSRDTRLVQCLCRFDGSFFSIFSVCLVQEVFERM